MVTQRNHALQPVVVALPFSPFDLSDRRPNGRNVRPGAAGGGVAVSTRESWQPPFRWMQARTALGGINDKVAYRRRHRRYRNDSALGDGDGRAGNRQRPGRRSGMLRGMDA